jgi:hypothetical protein
MDGVRRLELCQTAKTKCSVRRSVRERCFRNRHELHTGLATLPKRSIVVLEQAANWPKGPLFHREPMPPRVDQSRGGRACGALLIAGIVLLDPDNGVGEERKSTRPFPKSGYSANWDARLSSSPLRAEACTTSYCRYGRLMIELLNEGWGGRPLFTALTTVSGCALAA